MGIDQAIDKIWRGLKSHADMDRQYSRLMLAVEEPRTLHPLPCLGGLGLQLHTRQIPILVRYKIDEGRRGVARAHTPEGPVDKVHLFGFGATLASIGCERGF